jgi:hypothetical protein
MSKNINNISKERQQLKKWLESKINKLEESYYKPQYIITGGRNNPLNYDLYYDENKDKDKNIDLDLELNDKVTIKYMKNLVKNDINFCKKDEETQNILKSIETFGKKEIIIPNNTNRAHANYLFKKMIDISNNDGLLIEIPIFGNEDIEEFFPVFDKSMKEKFYNFCMTNSLKK